MGDFTGGASLSGGQLPSPSRWRDLFPLPPCEPVLKRSSDSTSARRRRCRVQKLVDESNQVIKVLNEIYAAPSDRNFGSSCTIPQKEGQHQIFRQLARLERCQLTCKERGAVIEELLQSSPAYSGSESTTVRVFDRALVSIPVGSSEPVEMAGLLDDAGRETIEDPSRCMLLNEDEWGKIIEEGDTFHPYMDVKLQKSAQDYHDFIHDLYEAGMISFTAEPRDLVTPFFVAKKNGKQRLILDCRGVNRRFRSPPSMSLSAGYSWAQLQVPDHKQLYVAQSDIKDYFYSLAMPEELQTLFSMPGIPSSLLRLWSVPAARGGDCNREGVSFPCLRVVPMGWSWAMWLSQRVHQQQCLVASGLSVERLLTDRRPPPSLEGGVPVMLPYADNLNVCGIDKDAVQNLKDKIVGHLRSLGFLVHEELDACTTADSLGYRIDGVHGIVQPIPRKLEQVRVAFEWLSRRPRVHSKVVEKLVGHAVHLMLIRRELLSLFRNLYDFVHRSSQEPCRLWRSAAREAGWVSVLLKLCSADLRTKWDPKITASDASLSGIAVCKKTVSCKQVSEIGSQKESWRFSSYTPSSNPREKTVDKRDVFSDVDTVKPMLQTNEASVDPFQLNPEFLEIEERFMSPESWEFCFAVHMQHREHITLLEGQGIVAALRHKLRACESFGRRHLHFNDNLAAVLIAEKGRSGSYEMLRVCRRLACLLLCANCSLITRWIPSEWNVADRGSRRWEAERKEDASKSRRAKEAADSIIYPNRYGTQVQRLAKAALSDACQFQPSQRQNNDDSNETSSERSKSGGEKGEETVPSKPSAVSPSFSGADPPRAEIDFRCGGQGLPSPISELPYIRPELKSEDRHQKEIRRSLDHLSESSISRRARLVRGNKGFCSRVGCKASLFPENGVAKEPSFTSGLDKARPRQHKTPDAVGIDSLAGSEDAGVRKSLGSFGRGGDVHVLLAPRGGASHQSGRSGETFLRNEIPFAESSSCRQARNFKSGSVRRDSHAGFPSDSRSWDNAAAFGYIKSPGALISTLLRRSQGSLGQQSGQLGPQRQVCHVPASSQRSQPRPSDELQRSGISQEKRTVAVRQQCPKIRGTCQGEPIFPAAAYPDTGGGIASCKDLPLGAPQVFLPDARKDKEVWVIELFAGSCHLARAAATAGYRALALDVLFGTSCDLLNPSVRHFVKEFARLNPVKLVWFGLPCQSWSRARRLDGGPLPLRDDDVFLWGKVNLSKIDSQKVNLGNQLLLHTVAMIHHFHAAQIPWVLENPWTSRCWLTAQLRELIAYPNVTLSRADFCQFNVPWRKATGLMFGHLDLSPMCKTCAGSSQRCSSSGKRHIVLQGKDSFGHWWTHRAQAYPAAFCKAIFECL